MKNSLSEEILNSISNFQESRKGEQDKQNISEKDSDIQIKYRNINQYSGSYPEPSLLPTQEAGRGIRFDFNSGIRVKVPKGIWHVKFLDIDTNFCLFECLVEDSLVFSEKKYFINARIEISEKKDGGLRLSHDYDAEGKDVAILLPEGTLGDTIGWFPYALKFQEIHKCRLTVVMGKALKELFSPLYPSVKIICKDEFSPFAGDFYATYYIGLFFFDDKRDWQPEDFRSVGLHRTAAYILGVSPEEVPPLVAGPETEERPIVEPYVVIASQASSQCKMWNNPDGWYETVKYLKENNYRVVCIDREDVSSYRRHWNCLPYGVEDQTGDRPLHERVKWLRHAEFFIGLSSGLSWLAWAAGTPVVLISGFTNPINEFRTPYRVFNKYVCNSCWHEKKFPFEHSNFLFCPVLKNTDKEFECTREISSEHVIREIRKLEKSRIQPRLSDKI